MDPQQPIFLSSLLSRYTTDPAPENRPYVTLTFAESEDAKIAGENGKQLILSGRESMVMTHWMRTMHDAIMIGIGTALNDNPQLNTRHLPPKDPDPQNREHNNPYHLPRPIILDSHLRFSPGCKLLQNYKNGTGRRPWIISADSRVSDPSFQARIKSLEEAGARVIPITSEGFELSIPNVLLKLYELGISSLMVEGGAKVIQSFLALRPNVLDNLIVTVAPVTVGEGVGYGVNLNYGGDMHEFKHAAMESFGADTVYAWST